MAAQCGELHCWQSHWRELNFKLNSIGVALVFSGTWSQIFELSSAECLRSWHLLVKCSITAQLFIAWNGRQSSFLDITVMKSRNHEACKKFPLHGITAEKGGLCISYIETRDLLGKPLANCSTQMLSKLISPVGKCHLSLFLTIKFEFHNSVLWWKLKGRLCLHLKKLLVCLSGKHGIIAQVKTRTHTHALTGWEVVIRFLKINHVLLNFFSPSLIKLFPLKVIWKLISEYGYLSICVLVILTYNKPAQHWGVFLLSQLCGVMNKRKLKSQSWFSSFVLGYFHSHSKPQFPI